MGLSATNARFLAFTARKHDITGMQMHYSNQKLALSRDMQRVSRDYQNALNSKIYKWSNNNGVTYSDLSYNNLMRPSSMNQNKAYLLTDLAGRVVVDSKYKEYAEIISNNGAYDDSIRNQLLSKATGISVQDLEQIHRYHEQIYDKKIEIDSYKIKNPEPDPGKYPGLQQSGIEDLLEKLPEGVGPSDDKINNLKFSDDIKTWSKAYGNSDVKINLTNEESSENKAEAALYRLPDIAGYLYNSLEKYIIDETDKQHFKNACEDISANSNLAVKDGDNYYLNVHEFIEQILGAYYQNGGESKTTNGKQDIIWYNTTDDNGNKTDVYNQYLTDQKVWQDEYNALIEEYNNLCSASGQLLTSDQEQMINFYDEIFSSIAEKGWVYNNSVTDSNYLNEMLQNNIYTITEVSRQHFCDEKEGHYYKNTYKTDVAGNMPKLFPMTDEEAIMEAQVEYENEKAIINEKETRIDLRMDTLKTELEAINTMMKSMEEIAKKNIERTMNITG